jgi:hypothetical protein
MHTGATCRPDMDRSKRERAVESIRSSLYGPFNIHFTLSREFRPETSVSFFLALGLPALGVLVSLSGRSSDRQANGLGLENDMCGGLYRPSACSALVMLT